MATRQRRSSQLNLAMEPERMLREPLRKELLLSGRPPPLWPETDPAPCGGGGGAGVVLPRNWYRFWSDTTYSAAPLTGTITPRSSSCCPTCQKRESNNNKKKEKR